MDWIEGFFGQMVEDWQNKSSQGYADDHIKDGVLIGGIRRLMMQFRKWKMVNEMYCGREGFNPESGWNRDWRSKVLTASSRWRLSLSTTTFCCGV